MSTELEQTQEAITSTTDQQWWQGSAIYHIYLRSFLDSNGDGHGDLRGAAQKLEYISSLGVQGIWLSPTMPSPNQDWGYDVSNYLDVQPDYGNINDLDYFISQAQIKGLKVLLDLVPNHTSAEHPWFISAISNRDSPWRDYYVFAKPKPDGSPPNNWLDATGMTAWTLDPKSGEYYLHNFLRSQPDLNWWNEAVHDEFEKIIKFWFDRGIAGLRIDVAHGLYKDGQLRDDPPAKDTASEFSPFGLAEEYSKNQSQVHDIYRKWRQIADSYVPKRLLLGETWVSDLERLALFYGDNDELNLAFNFLFTFSEFSPVSLAKTVLETLKSLPEGSTPVWTASNHDISRFPTRWANGSEPKSRTGLAILTTLPGTVVLYYGDEPCLGDVDVPLSDQQDQMTSMVSNTKFHRDRARTPMPWTGETGRGFTNSNVKPWLPFGPNDGRDVESQDKNPSSCLNLTRALLWIRNLCLDSSAQYREIEVTKDYWRYEVGKLSVFANFSDHARKIHLQGTGDILTTNQHSIWIKDPKPNITVAAWETVIRSS